MKVSFLPILFITITATLSAQSQIKKITVPVGGNSWITVEAPNGTEHVTNAGWTNWTRPEAVWSTYVKLAKAGTISVSALLNVPAGTSQLQCTIGGISKIVTVTGKTNKEYKLGDWQVSSPGYIRIDMKGTTKTGAKFANVTNLYLSGTAVNADASFVQNNKDGYFLWGRRGPSVHINYDVSEIEDDVEWFYSEITVPQGNDVIGSYFMADGFGEGYFGMQVNSPDERRVLFSVWSPYDTDNPASIPADKKIALLRKGNNVQTGEFGNEGSGGQSYLSYNWKAGQSYGFLLQAKPSGKNNTTYTAWFYAPEQKKWLLIASFSRPATNTYLTNLYSFLENFEPSMGNITRKAFYHNQWAVTKGGEWKPLNKMLFTGDNTAIKKFRLDYDGGVDNGKFYLRNCGFFNDNAKLETAFSVPFPKQQPVIDFSSLP